MELISILSVEERAARLAAVGRSSRPRPPYPLLFPQSLVERARQHLWVNGEQGLEQVVLWSGYATERGVILETLMLPETEATWGWVHILPHEQPRIIEWLQSNGQLMFVEAHTHGEGRGAAEISPEDRRHPAGRQDGFLTIIVPGYARRGINFAEAGVWECLSLEWGRMSPANVLGRLRVVPDQETHDALV